MYQLFFIELFNQSRTFWYIIILYLGESKGEKIFPEKNNFYNRITGCSCYPERKNKVFLKYLPKCYLWMDRLVASHILTTKH